MINMEGDVLTLESLKLEVRQTFANVYSALKARELQTIRQIDAIWKQCGNGTLLSVDRNCLQNIDISYVNESSLFTEIRKFGKIDFSNLNIDSNIFTMEEYVNPQEDHLYSYKCLDNNICPDRGSDDSIEAIINHNAIKQITQNNECVCYVNISASETESKFKDSKCVFKENSDNSLSDSSGSSNIDKECNEKNVQDANLNNDTIEFCNETASTCEASNKLNPTQDWLNQIINETETEPSQVLDLMEHTTIECS